VRQRDQIEEWWMSSPFDELSKALARGVSRRQALKMFGAGIAGSVLALMGIERSSALVKTESCAEFCSGFPPNQQGRCRSVCVRCPGGAEYTERVSGHFVCLPGGSFPTYTWPMPTVGGGNKDLHP
jgi:hypothetical protein